MAKRGISMDHIFHQLLCTIGSSYPPSGKVLPVFHGEVLGSDTRPCKAPHAAGVTSHHCVCDKASLEKQRKELSTYGQAEFGHSNPAFWFTKAIKL